MTLFVLLALVSAVVTLGLSFVVLKLSHRYRLYPKIRERDVHTRPTPRLGGIAMFLGILVAFGVAYLVSAQFAPLRLVFSNPQQILAILGGALMIVLLELPMTSGTSTG
jgi:UDP-GlcNAc:undecaprenyl-phosphate GlcNAc-1-phosphate transferase